MTNEIKEILRDSLYNGLTNEAYREILDYITNLQEEKKQLKDGWQQEVYDRNKILNDWLDLQRRIDKAIKKIEKDAKLIDLEDGYNTCMKVIDILRGEE